MIEAKEIRKRFGTLEVLRDIDLHLEPGGITALLGPSGAGKTTLLQILGTLMQPDSGKVLYDGEDVTALKDKKLSAFRNRHIGFVFQFHQLLPEFSAEENVMLPAIIGGATRTDARRRADELLDVLGMSERLRHKPAQLSGGECQRVAVARALVNKPSVVFADEPTGSLDPVNRDEIRSLFARLNSEFGHTFVIVTHDLSLASIAGRVLRMDGGVISSDDLTANQSAPGNVIEIEQN